MKHLLVVLGCLAAPAAMADALEHRDLAYARCLVNAYEHGLTSGETHDIYVIACMRVAGYEPEKGKLTGGEKYSPAVLN